MPAEHVSRLWRRFLRFSVLGLIVVLLIGGWLSWFVRSARIQREAVAALRKDGNFVEYNLEWRNGSFVGPPGNSRALRRLVDLLGIDYFGYVTFVWVPDSTPMAIADVCAFPTSRATPPGCEYRKVR